MSVPSEIQVQARTASPHWTADKLKRLVNATMESGRQEPIDLSHQNFDGENLNDLSLNGFIMSGASFRGTSLVSTDLSKVDLRGANLEGATLIDAKLVGANLCELEGTSNIGDSLRTNLTGAKLDGADLCGAKLRSAILANASLRGAILKDCVMDNADLKGVDFSRAVIENARFRRYDLGKNIKQEEEHRFGEAQQIYLALKENFVRIGAYDDASWAYVKERSNERGTFFPPYALKYFGPRDLPKDPQGPVKTIFIYGTFFAKYFLKWVQSASLYLIWGYGQRPSNAFAFSIVIMSSFSILYYLLGGIEAVSTSGASPSQLAPIDFVTYSMSAFVTNNPDNLKPANDLIRILTSLESMCGVAAFALFTAALGQRMGGK